MFRGYIFDTAGSLIDVCETASAGSCEMAAYDIAGDTYRVEFRHFANGVETVLVTDDEGGIL